MVEKYWKDTLTRSSRVDDIVDDLLAIRNAMSVSAALQSGFRPREQRVTVLIPSRLRLATKWVDIVIHNVSSRGLMGGCDEPPQLGSYIEIRRGTIVIVGRVQWVVGRFFGVKSQERLSVAALVDEPRLASRLQHKTESNAGERRVGRRLAHEAQMARSRASASAFQFTIIALLGVTLAVIAAQGVYGLLSRPANAIGAALDGEYVFVPTISSVPYPLS